MSQSFYPWAAIIVACAALSITVLYTDLVRLRADAALWYVCGAIFLRLLSSAFHQVTYDPVIGPLSINALLSVMTVFVGFFMIDRRLFLLKQLWPMYCMCALMLLSAVINGTLITSVVSLIKWSLLLMLVAALVDAQFEHSFEQVTGLLLKAFTLPVALQCVALLLHHVKPTELDGSISYVGGYHHEAVFSVVLATAFVLSLLRYWHDRHKLSNVNRLLPLALFALMAMTNYRTTIIAMLMPASFYCAHTLSSYGRGVTKLISLCVVCGLLAIGISYAGHSLIERFGDIDLVLSHADALVQRPEYYTDWQQDYFSARAYIWSQYLTAWGDASFVHRVIGLGPDSWEHVFPKYAHNTFISFLYEIGLVGVAILAGLFANMLIWSRRSPMLFVSILGFVGLNLGTMPLWQIEGMFFMSILAAIAIFQSIKRISGRAQANLRTVSQAA